MERLRIAITGASGFVGANLVRHFANDHEVFALSRNKNNWRLGDIDTVFFDLQNRPNVRETITKIKPDVLIHCAVYGGYPFERNTDTIISTNILGSMNVIDACNGVPLFINTGSSSEYGIKSGAMRETDIPEPYTDYAMSKALVTDLLKAGKINAVTLRLFSVYGYFEEKHRLVPCLLYSAIKGTTATLSSKNNVRDFVFIEDVAKAYELIIKKSKDIASGSIFNVGSGRQSRVGDVANMVKAKVEWSSKIREKEPDRIWKADTHKIRKELGWTPEYSLSEGLKKTKKWMATNIKFYE